MSELPSASLVAKVETLIFGNFNISEQEAHEYAAGLVGLAEDWGGPENAAKLDWAYRIKKDLGERLRWRSADEREKFRRQLEDQYKSYEFHIRRPNRA